MRVEDFVVGKDYRVITEKSNSPTSHNYKIGDIVKMMSVSFCNDILVKGGSWSSPQSLNPSELEEVDGVSVGTILNHPGHSWYRTIIAKAESGEFITKDSDDETISVFENMKEAQLVGWSIRTSEREMTVAQIAEALGYSVKIVK